MILTYCHSSQYRTFLLVLITVVAIGATTFIINPVHAKKKDTHSKNRPYRSALLIEVQTGKVLQSYKPRKRVIPASIVKMMTILLALERVKEKSIHLSDIVTASRKASKIGGHQVYLAQGERFPLEKLLQAVAISSANDAAYAVAEHIAGDVNTFVNLMNERAKQLEMTDTHFINSNGLPPNRNQSPNRMSARDAAILARELLKYPIVTKWGSTKHAPFRDGKFTLTNTNRLVGHFHGLDGLKTGSYRQAGYSIVATAKRENLRLIAVILGSDRPSRRFVEARKLLAWGFTRYRLFETTPNSVKRKFRIEIKHGEKRSITLLPKGGFRSLVHRGQEMKITTRPKIPATLTAPVIAGQIVGLLVYELNGKKIGEIKLTAAESVKSKPRGFFQSLITIH